MKKIIFTLAILSVLGLTAQPVSGTSFANLSFSDKADEGGKKKEISIGSNRASGDMLLRFTADKSGEAIITILNESGKIVLQQTNQLRNTINTIPLKNITSLAEGSYMVRLVSNNEIYTTRLLIWN
ncbi:MAG: T9SS type A sorting domain-containing protein [Ferruginibacter sp.]